MRRAETRQRPGVAGLVLHDAALLVVVFYSPILWGAFNSGGQAFAAALIGIASVAALTVRWRQGRGPAVIPNPIHLPALVFLVISGLSASFAAVSHHASWIELSRLASGVLLFWLVANRALLPAAPARAVAIAFACSALLVLFVRVPGESDLSLQALSAPGLFTELVAGAGVSLRLFALIGVALVAGLVALDRGRPDPVRWWVWALVISAAFSVAAYGLREKYLTLYMLHNPSWRIFSTFFNPNPLGGFLALAFFLAVAAALMDSARRRRMIWGLAAVLLLAAVIPTYSKGALLGLLVAGVVFLALAARASARPRRSLRLLAVLIGAALLAAGLAWWRVPSLRAKALTALSPESASNMFRLIVWRGSARMAAANPLLGIGPGGFKHAFMQYAIGGYTEATHENYLQIAAEQGFPGLLAFLWIFAAALFTARRALAKAQDWHHRLPVIGAVAGLTVFLVHSLLDYDWYIGAFGLVIWLLLGIIAHHAHGREAAVPAARPEEAPARARRRASRQPQPKKEAEQGVHHLPWPQRAVGRGAVSVGFALAVLLSVRAPLRNALAQTALNAGNQAFAAALAAYGRADALTVGRYLDTAAQAFSDATQYDPSWAEAWERYGLLLNNISRGKEAEAAVRRAVALEPTNFQPRLSLAQLYYDQDQFAKAAASYREALARYPNNTRALRKLGQTYQRLGDEESARAAYRRMAQVESSDYNRYRALSDIDVDTDYAYAHYYLARAALQDYAVGRRPDALPAAMHEFAAALEVIASYQHRGKRIDEMFREVGQPREDRGTDLRRLEARTRWRLAEANEKMGDVARATQQREQALQLDPGVARSVAAEDGGR